MKSKTKLIAAVVVAALGGANYTYNTIQANRIEAAAKAAVQEKLRLAQERRDALAAELLAQKPALLAEAQRLAGQGSFAESRALLVKFAPLRDADVEDLLAAVNRHAKIAMRIKQLSDELVMKPPVERSMAIYRELKSLEPSNPLWLVLMQDLQPQFAAAQAQKASAEKAAARKQAVRSLFSGWDGSVQSVEAAIKQRLKDPDSYKHVETRYSDTGIGDVTVITQYRARNSFNAVVTSVAVAMVSPEGELVSINLK